MMFAFRQVLIAISALIIIAVLLPSLQLRDYQSSFDASPEFLSNRQANITDAFQHAWNGYTKHCFGRDNIRPVSNTCENDFGGWGVTAIDSLSTAIIMRNEAVTVQILQFIETLDLKRVAKGSQIQFFEVFIRHFAGMISAWDLLNGPFSDMAKDPVLLQGLRNKMVELGDVLACAFITPSGVPRDWINPSSCETDSGTMTSIANAGIAILGFARLSEITGNDTYVKLAQRAETHLLDPCGGEPFPGLLGSHISVNDGEIVDSSGSWGAFADSFYEYLIKAYVYDSNVYGKYLKRWLVAAESTIQSIGSHPYGHPEWTFLASWSRTSLSRRIESLSWFTGGNFIIGGIVTNNRTMIDYGLSIADAAGGVYNMTRTGLGGEFVTWDPECSNNACDEHSSVQITDSRYNLRPEVLETWYYAYRVTKDRKYMEWSWSAFESIVRYCRIENEFSAINDVNSEDGGGKADKQESFVLAEVLKYIYLIYLEASQSLSHDRANSRRFAHILQDQGNSFHVQDSRTGAKNTWVFNAEAHPLRVAGPSV